MPRTQAIRVPQDQMYVENPPCHKASLNCRCWSDLLIGQIGPMPHISANQARPGPFLSSSRWPASPAWPTNSRFTILASPDLVQTIPEHFSAFGRSTIEPTAQALKNDRYNLRVSFDLRGVSRTLSRGSSLNDCFRHRPSNVRCCYTAARPLA